MMLSVSVFGCHCQAEMPWSVHDRKADTWGSKAARHIGNTPPTFRFQTSIANGVSVCRCIEMSLCDARFSTKFRAASSLADEPSSWELLIAIGQP